VQNFCVAVVSDIAVFVLKRDVKLQLTHSVWLDTLWHHCTTSFLHPSNWRQTSDTSTHNTG